MADGIRRMQLVGQDSEEESSNHSQEDATPVRRLGSVSLIESVERQEQEEAAASLLSHLMFLHKCVFEVENEEAGQKYLSALAEKDAEITDPNSASSELFDLEAESTNYGKLLRIAVYHSARPNYRPPHMLHGRWKDATGKFYGGHAINIDERAWGPEGHATKSTFHRESDALVERTREGVEKRMTVTQVTGTSVVVRSGESSFLLQRVHKWERWEHFRVLKTIWETMSVASVADILGISGPGTNKFAHSLCLKIPSELVGTYSRQQLRSDNEVTVEAADLWPDTDESPPQDEDDCKEQLAELFMKSRREDSQSSSFIRRIQSQFVRPYPKKTEVNIYYCCLEDAFDVGLQRPPPVGHLAMLICLEGLPQPFQIFTTPLGLAVAANSWRKVCFEFFHFRCMDMAFQWAISYNISPASRSVDLDADKGGPWIPSQFGFLFVVLLLFRNAFVFVVEFILTIVMWLKSGMSSSQFPFTAFTLMRLCIELYSFRWLVWLLTDLLPLVFIDDIHDGKHNDGGPLSFIAGGFFTSHTLNTTEPLTYHGRVVDPRADCLHNHPMGLAMLIFAKYIQWIISILNFEIFRHTLLPTWFAIQSRESVMFISYMLLMTFGCALTYMALPFSEELLAEHNDNDNYFLATSVKYFLPLFRMFRLNIMGDFDMSELQGKGEGIASNCTDAFNQYCALTIEGQVSGKIPGQSFAFLKLFVGILTIIFPVIFLNVYVGLVSDAYANAKSNIVQISGLFVATSIRRELAYRQMRLHLCPCQYRKRSRDAPKGVFIRVPTALVGEPM